MTSPKMNEQREGWVRLSKKYYFTLRETVYSFYLCAEVLSFFVSEEF